MGYAVAQKLIASHLVEGRMEAGTAIGLRIDQTLTQDATGTLVMLELEAMGVQRVCTELSAQYVDHNLLQTDFKNADDHLFLRSACQKFGLVSFDINPTSRQILENLTHMGLLAKLIRAGARLHQAGCNGCIGMGQAPATGRISLRTVPRNFPGRSGTPEDQVYLCSPETATASALMGVITDPRSLDMAYPRVVEPAHVQINTAMLVPPAPAGTPVELVKGPNIVSLPPFEPLPDTVEGPVLIKLGDNISTDEILPAGEQVLPLRSNLPAISRFVFAPIDATYYERALPYQHTGSLIVGGRNYGQGSSREHAALAPRFLGVKAVIAHSFARIHRQNLINFGVLPLTFTHPDDWHRIAQGDILRLPDMRQALRQGTPLTVQNQTRHETYRVTHALTDRQVAIMLAGSLLSLFRARHQDHRLSHAYGMQLAHR